MAFSCLIDGDYRDTEKFYAEAAGKLVDREWPGLAAIIDDLISRFNAHMADMADRTGDSQLGRLRADILGHVRGKAALRRGVFSLDVPTGGGKNARPRSGSRLTTPRRIEWNGSSTVSPSPPLSCQIASKCDPFSRPKMTPSDGAETGVAEPRIAEQSRSWRAASDVQEAMRGS
jgi:hypothetical protein